MKRTTPPGSAAIPVAPILSAATYSSDGQSAMPSLLDVRNQVLLTSGRAAIAVALEQLQIGKGDEVLVSAYHCIAMVSPIRWIGAAVKFYPVKEDLTFDEEALIAQVGPRTRAILVAHFFGFPAPLTKLRAACDRLGIALLEDCAHAMFGQFDYAAVGCTGDYAIGSVMKFYPLFDGGCLVSARRPVAATLEAKGFLFQVKAAMDIVERAVKWGRLSALALPINAMVGVRNGLKRLVRIFVKEAGGSLGPGAAEGGFDFEPSWRHTPISKASNRILRKASRNRIVTRRREIYRRLLAALQNVSGGKPLHGALVDGVVPYVFPFVLTTPKVSFPKLQAAGVPMYRWEQVATDQCAVSARYVDALVQFPCHQELTDAEVTWLIATIKRVLSD